MSFEMLNYSDVMKATKEQRRYLLLGNGFSMSYNRDRFSFTSLLESAVKNKLIEESSAVYQIFKEFDTKDFEEVVKLLETSVRVLKKYGVLHRADEKKILDDSILLKKHLVEIITNNHPEKITEISDEEYLNSASFINNFEKIYTLNYDLLLYWSTIKLMDFIIQGKIKKGRLSPTDGFHEDDEFGKDYVIFGNDSSPQEIYFLHGALHIFDKKNKIIKNTYSRTDIALKEQTLENLKNDIYPIFVSEGTSEQKQAKIIHNAYLNNCYKSLSSIGGTKEPSNLIIFGTLLKTNDTHIREAILKNKVKNIYFGISSEAEKNSLEEFSKKLAKARVPKKVFFYDYATVTVWR
ncbi:MAG: DUF4917 family protein [Sulfurimonas sp.]|uniref:DUF4917 family protein n=1 Tax=Sulfurimonas sp. TaxID=2022749 RepID=UPI00263358FA|nr:DUF4917 family protein [Sulfurimonas sp.]MDD5400926.1 DUF4917 family protein [Sulfurimonas sp.]